MTTQSTTQTSFTTDDLTLATRPQRLDEGRFRLLVPDGWQQGRGAYGGLVLGALARAIESSEPDRERRLRSLSGELAGPVLAGEATIQVGVLRRGSGVSTFSATLTQGDEVLAQATAVLGRTRVADRRWSPPPPEWPAASWASVAPLPTEVSMEGSGAGGAVFARHFEFRPTGPLPFLGGTDPIASGWVRPRRAPEAIGAPELVALADAWWPALLTVEPRPRPASTVAFTVQLLPPSSPLDPGQPLYHRARAVAAQDGYVVELRELWSAQGDLLALNQQTFVIIK